MINLKMIRDFMKKGFLLLMLLLLVPKAEAQTSDDNYRMPIAETIQKIASVFNVTINDKKRIA